MIIQTLFSELTTSSCLCHTYGATSFELSHLNFVITGCLLCHCHSSLHAFVIPFVLHLLRYHHTSTLLLLNSCSNTVALETIYSFIWFFSLRFLLHSPTSLAVTSLSATIVSVHWAFSFIKTYSAIFCSNYVCDIMPLFSFPHDWKSTL